MVAGGGIDEAGWEESAVTIIVEMKTWQLTELKWEGVSQILGQIEAAVASGSDREARQAVIDLECAGPVRAVPAGSRIGIPAPLRERADELIHTLAPRPAAAGDASLERQLPGEQAGAAR